MFYKSRELKEWEIRKILAKIIRETGSSVAYLKFLLNQLKNY